MHFTSVLFLLAGLLGTNAVDIIGYSQTGCTANSVVMVCAAAVLVSAGNPKDRNI